MGFIPTLPGWVIDAVLAVALFCAGAYSAHHVDTIKLNGVISANNAAIEKQNAQAATRLAADQKQVAGLQMQAAGLTDQLNREHDQHVQEIAQINADAMRRIAAAGGLRFKPDPVTTGAGGGISKTEIATPSSAATAGTIRLPDAITANLLGLADDADKLAADYATCYAYVQKIVPLVNNQVTAAP